MKDIHKLDTVLSVFSDTPRERGLHLLQVQEMLHYRNVDFSGSLLREILKKLIKDTYLRVELDEAIIPPHRLKDIEYYILTFEGVIFLNNGGYVSQERKRNITEFPKNYWWVIAIFTFFLGLFSDVVKEVINKRVLPSAGQLKVSTSKGNDSTKTH